MTLDKLNGVLEDIAGEIGYTATTALVDWFGGGSLYVPQVASNDHPICRVIGSAPYAHLVRSYGGETISLPLDYRRERTRRDRLIGALLAKGVGTKEIAKVAAMTERQVHHIRVALEEAGIIPHILHAGVTITVMDGADSGIDHPDQGMGHASPAL